MPLLMKTDWASHCCTDRELRNILSIGEVVMMNTSFTPRLKTKTATNCFRLLKC